MSPLQNSPDLPPTRASVRGRGTGRQQKKVPDKTADVSLTEAVRGRGTGRKQKKVPDKTADVTLTEAAYHTESRSSS
ncbi:hypothetical protein V8E54_011401 [Elaphomyces granulatus]